MVNIARSVICVVDNFDRFYSSSLNKSQKKALEHKIPLAVVHVISGNQEKNIIDLKNLRKQELELAEFNVPLIILIGEAEKMLNTFFSYIGESFKFNQDYQKSSEKLVVHPYKWPSDVISTEELIRKGFTC